MQPEQDQADDEKERKALGVEKADWDAAFAWADEPGSADAPGGGEPSPNEPFMVWPENWAVAMLFLKCETQWRFTPNGRFFGLAYAGVDVVMNRNKKLCPDPDLAFEQIQVMELAARGVLNG